MEILKHGNTPRFSAACPNCGCVVSFLASEAVREWSPDGDDGELYVRCPECNTIIREVHFEKPVR